MKYSVYQEHIFDQVKNTSNNILVKATAGSGKTTTLIKSLEHINPDQSVFVTAFNKAIVEELEKKVNIPNKNVTISTLHSYGFRILKKNGLCPNENCIVSQKYINEFYINKKKYISQKFYFKFDVLTDNIKNYIDLARCYLCKTKKDLLEIQRKYNIKDVGDEKDIVLKLLKWGKNNTDIIDMTDMIYLPVVLDLVTPTYDWIFVDECQDLNRCERELILKSKTSSGRYFFVGDSDQSINAFKGADPSSFDVIKTLPNIVLCPLSISYRCANKIIEEAQKIVPSIEKNNNGIEGIIKHNANLDNVKDGDLILCPNNAPLFDIYTMLTDKGHKVHFLGKDIKEILLEEINAFVSKYRDIDLEISFLIQTIYKKLFKKKNLIIEQTKVDEKTAFEDDEVKNFLFIIMMIEKLSVDLKTVGELRVKIEDTYKDDDKNGIILSTIHKAKGTEADTVYICGYEQMPRRKAKLDWEIEEERHLQFVAVTRAKHELNFLSNYFFVLGNISKQKSIDDLKIIEEQLKLVDFGKKAKEQPKIVKRKQPKKLIQLSLFDTPKEEEPQTFKSLKQTKNKTKRKWS